MSMKIKPEAVASIRKMAAVCRGKHLSTKQAGLDRFVQGYLTIFHLWEDEEALFNPGQINPAEFMDALQVEPSEFELIKYPERGTCLYRCGIERYLLQVIAPDYKSAIFGKAGGR